jgi:ribonuclease G
MNDELLIEEGVAETRIALIEDGRLAELHIAPEGAAPAGALGDIWLGRVTRVEPSLQAAFVDLGLPRAGFLAAADATAAGGEAPIARLVHEGEAVLVQAIREAGAGKGVKLSADIALAGRFVVYAPRRSGVTVSRRIEDGEERRRLAAIVAPLVSEGGCILRTAAASAAAELIAADLARLAADWRELRVRSERAAAPVLLRPEEGAIERALRDLAHPGIGQIRVDGPAALARVRAWATARAPDLVERIARHDGPGALFERHDVEGEIARALAPRLVLPSGAAIVFGATEALTAIDVDSGGLIGGEREATALRANLEAAAEIARQLRLRAIGGIVVIDFLRLADARARDQVVRALRGALARDPAPTQVLDMSALGLVECARKRTGPALAVRLTEACAGCGGGGLRPTLAAIAAAAMRRATAEAAALPGRRLEIACAPDLAAALEGGLIGRLSLRLGAQVTVRPEAARARDSFEVRVR